MILFITLTLRLPCVIQSGLVSFNDRLGNFYAGDPAGVRLPCDGQACNGSRSRPFSECGIRTREIKAHIGTQAACAWDGQVRARLILRKLALRESSLLEP